MNFKVWGFPGMLVVKNLPANAGDVRDVGSIPRLGRSSRGGHATNCSTLTWRITMDRGDWWARVPRVAKSRTQLKRLYTYTMVCCEKEP